MADSLKALDPNRPIREADIAAIAGRAHPRNTTERRSGMPPQMFSDYTVHRLPLFNMHYSGAIKTAIYGLYLSFLEPEFSVISWRLVGISSVAAGLVVFTLLGRRIVSPAPIWRV